MLGIGSGSSKSGKIRRLVKNGLQAWYKADETQAPLGEEEVVNGNFSLGSEMQDVASGSIVGWTKFGNNTFVNDGDAVKITYVDNDNGALLKLKDSDQLNADLVVGKTYKLEITTKVNEGSVQWVLEDEVDGGSGVSTNTFDTLTSTSFITQTIYFVSTDTNDHYIYPNSMSEGQEVWIKNISVKQTNPNDSWVSDTDTGGTVTFKDGSVDIVTDGAGAGIQQVGVFTVGKKYEVIVDATINDDGAGLKVGSENDDDNIIDVISATGVVTATFTATHANLRITREGLSAGNYTINSVSIKEVTNSVKDFSPNNNNAVLYSGKCLDFDGTGDYITIADDDSLDVGTGDFTLAAWVYCDTLTTAQVMLSKLNGTAGYELYKGTDAGGSRILLDVDDGSGVKQSYDFGASSGLTGSTWHRIVVVADRDSNVRLYTNGTLVSTLTTSTAGETWKTFSSDSLDNTADFTIGAKSLDQTLPWFGMIADVQLYKKAWTTPDVYYDWENPDKDVFDGASTSTTLGAELVSNGSDIQENANGWSDQNDGWSYSNGVVSFEYPGTGDTFNLSQSNVFEVGKRYQVTYTVSNYERGNVKVLSGSGSPTDIDRTANGTYTQTFAQTAYTNLFLNFGSDEDNTKLSVSNVSVKEVLSEPTEILPTDCTALYRLNEGAGDRVYNAAPVLSAEKLSNTDFTTDSVWGKHGSPQADINTTVPNALYLPDGGSHSSQSSVIESGKIYKYTVTAKSETDTLSDLHLQSGSTVQKAIEDVPTSYTTYTGVITSDDTTFTLAEGSGGSIIVDSISLKEVSLSNSYALVGDPTWTATAQPYIPQYAMSSYSKKMVFDGSDDNIDCSNNSSINDIFSGGGSWSAWFSAETDGEGDAGTMLCKGMCSLRTRADAGGDITMEFLHTFSGDNGGWSAPTDAVLLNKINHIVVTYDNSNVSNNPVIYINGIKHTVGGDFAVTEAATGPSGSASSDAGQNFIIGAQNNSGTEAYDGFIDEVSVWDKELSATEVQEIFNAGMALDCRDHSAYLGSEELTNADFSTSGNITDTAVASLGWKTGNSDEVGASISGGELILDRPTGGDSDDARVFALTGTSDQVLTIGRRYQFTYTISSVVGAARLHHYTGSAWVSCPNTVGTHTVSWLQATSKQFLIKNEVESTTLKLSSVSVKELQLSGYWRNNSVDTWTDLSPYGNNGTTSGSPTTIQLQEVPYFKKDTFGLPMNRVRERGLIFDGAGYLKIEDDSSIDLTTAATWEFWLKLPSQGVAAKSFVYDKNASYECFIESTRKINFKISQASGATDTCTYDTALVVDTWYHVACTFTNADTTDNWIIYIDGSPVTTHSADAPNEAIVTNGNALFVGAENDLTNKLEDVKVDDIKIYNRTLSAAEISKNYKATKSRHTSTSNWSDDFSSDFI